MKLAKDLEKRMYFLVPYNISEIQKSIQAGHAALEYAYYYRDNQEMWDFIRNHKTWVILNGGTTNRTVDPETGLCLGSMDNYLGDLCNWNISNPKNKIDFGYFYEPDLNDALTAICLIVDERVFNREKYPDFKEWSNNVIDTYSPFINTWEKIKENYINEIGEDIYFLKELLNTKKLA